jgi:thiol-disulfide isomerase/thioredoxin
MTHVRLLFAVLLLSAVSFAGEVAWVKNYDDALKQAGEQKKFVVLDMSASWCGFCRKMAREVYPAQEFVDYSRSHVFVRLFVDTDPQGEQLAEKFGVRGFPTILVLDAQGKEVGRVVGARPSSRLIQDLKEITRLASPADP